MRKTRRSGWLVLGGVVALLLLFGGRLAEVAVDWLWFGELGQQRVLVTRWSAQILLGLVVGVLLFAAIYSNVLLARRASPPLTPRFDDIPMGARVRRLARAGLSWGLVLGAAAFAVMGAVVAATQWELFLLFRNGVPFGTRDPVFGKDVGFYVFTFPFWRLVYGWLSFALLAALVGAALVYYADRAIDLRQGYARVAVSARVHLSVLLGLLVLVKAWGYRLDAYQLLFSVSDALVGAGYTDVHARLLALNLLSGLAVVAALGFLLNAHYRVLWLPGVALAMMAVAWLLVGVSYPATVQQIRVKPNELALESPYIRRHIEATRAAYGLDAVEVEPFKPKGQISAGDLRNNGPTLQNIRLWDYRPLRETYQQLQGLYTYYRFNNVDIDRYTLDGRYRQVMLSARELYYRNLPPSAQTWVLKRLVYTHGYGVVMSPVNAADTAGRPIFFARDMPQEAHPDLQLKRPQIYFGEGTDEWVIVRSREQEFDYPAGEESRTTRYAGNLGIGIGSRLRRLLFGYHLGDATLLVSSAVTPESRLLIRREVAERSRTLAPFLQYDNDPYAVVAEGRIFWVQDAYTTSAFYPYSAPFPMTESRHMGGSYANLGSSMRQGFNYLRNSVKVVTDAYDGTVRFYVTDPKDPVLRAYSGIFPSLFQPLEAMPESLRRHLRYPEDLLRAQAVMYGLYHTLDPTVFYRRTDAWSIPRESLTQTVEPRSSIPLPPGAEAPGSSASYMEPYYVIMRLPGQEREEFLLMLPFTYRQRPNMAAWLAARSDGGAYGRLKVYVFPQGVQREGPAQVESLIDQDPQISSQLTLWEGAGSKIVWGNLLVIPIANSILYVRPLFLVASRAGIPELKRVILAHQGRVVMEPTLDAALTTLFGSGAQTGEEETDSGTISRPSTTRPPEAERLRALARDARQALDAALAAQKRGDWAGYGAGLKKLEDAVRALEGAAARP